MDQEINSSLIFNDKLTVKFDKTESIEVDISIMPELDDIPVEKHAAIINAILLKYNSDIEIYDWYGRPLKLKKWWQFWKKY